MLDFLGLDKERLTSRHLKYRNILSTTITKVRERERETKYWFLFKLIITSTYLKLYGGHLDKSMNSSALARPVPSTQKKKLS